MHNFKTHFSTKLVLIKASLSYELLASGQAQTRHLDNTFNHINPTDQKPLLEYFERAVLTSFMQPTVQHCQWELYRLLNELMCVFSVQYWREKFSFENSSPLEKNLQFGFMSSCLSCHVLDLFSLVLCTAVFLWLWGPLTAQTHVGKNKTSSFRWTTKVLHFMYNYSVHIKQYLQTGCEWMCQHFCQLQWVHKITNQIDLLLAQRQIHSQRRWKEF